MPLEVVPFRCCGWCITDLHDKCKRELEFYNKLFVCSCDCVKDYVPVHLRPVERTEEKEGIDK